MTVGRIPNVEGGIQPTLLTTAGDIMYASSASNPDRLGIGTAGQVLQVNSGATAPEWATLTSGGMTLIQETVASSATGITFGSIPSTYKQLVLVWSGTQHSATSTDFALRFNNDSGNNYAENYIQFAGSTPSGSVGAGNYVGQNSGYRTFGRNNNVSGTLAETSKGFIIIDNYASSTKLKTFEILSAHRDVANGINNNYSSTGIYNSTSAITSLDIVRTTGSATLSNVTNTTIRLYGVS